MIRGDSQLTEEEFTAQQVFDLEGEDECMVDRGYFFVFLPVRKLHFYFYLKMPHRFGVLKAFIEKLLDFESRPDLTDAEFSIKLEKKLAHSESIVPTNLFYYE